MEVFMSKTMNRVTRRHFRKLIACIAVLAVFAMSAFGSYAMLGAAPGFNAGGNPISNNDISGKTSFIFGYDYINIQYKMTGKVCMIDFWCGSPYIRIKSDENGITDFIIEAGRTVIKDSNGLISLDQVVIGDTVDIYFKKPLVVTLQFPPRFTADEVVKDYVKLDS
jgi:hypothetical protein